MSDVLAIRANNNGRLQLSISTDSVKLDTQWTGCTNPKMGESTFLHSFLNFVDVGKKKRTRWSWIKETQQTNPSPTRKNCSQS
jgi:Hus1-like protein